MNDGMAIGLISEMLRMALALTWPLFAVILGVGLLTSVMHLRPCGIRGRRNTHLHLQLLDQW
jgi:hypothetical protein